MKTTISKIAAQSFATSANLIRIPSAVLRRLAFTTVCMLAGLIAGPQALAVGTWAPVTNLPYSTQSTWVVSMTLLSDGTVMVLTGGTSQVDGKTWYKLKPDSSGRYVNGTWTQLASMNFERGQPGTGGSNQMLKNGRVFVAGGEGAAGKANAEIYNPVANSWTNLPALPDPAYAFNDACSMVLPDGHVLIALVYGTWATRLETLRKTIVYDPDQNTWSNPQQCLGIHNETTWVKLPDNSILMVDLPEDGSHGGAAERFIPSTSQWISDATVPVDLWSWYEIGPAFLLPNGKAICFGGSGHTAIYTPSGSTAPGTWVAGPDIPTYVEKQCAFEAPGAMLPNGKILLATQPPASSDGSIRNREPVVYYEYNYVTNTYALVPPPIHGTDPNTEPTGHGLAPTNHLMLTLPDGTVLLAEPGFLFSPPPSNLFIYTPDGSPLSQGQPTISSITVKPDGYQLTGTKLNGISEGASFGDDHQVSTNYPIVKLTSGSNVYFGRTFNWSSTGVMTGTNPVTTIFSRPKLSDGTDLPDGMYNVVVAANGISSNPYYYFQVGKFDFTGSLGNARYAHTATLVGGKVLVAGGYGSSGTVISSAELYDPATGTWSPTGSMSAARYAHTATLLPGNKVLVAGGTGNSGALSSAELYDLTAGTWSPTGSLSATRYAHAATSLNDVNGRVLVAGGYGSGGGPTSSAEIYNPTAGTWSATGSMSVTRREHTATLLSNGKVLVAGGYGGSGSGSWLSSAELYDPAPGTWATTGSLSSARYAHTATLLPNGKVLVIGGYGGYPGPGTYLSSAEVYSPAGGGTWSTTGSLSTARYAHTATLLSNGRVLVAGGISASGSYPTSTQVYNPVTGTWSYDTTGSMYAGRYAPTATLLPSGVVLVAGGYNGTPVSSAELFY